MVPRPDRGIDRDRRRSRPRRPGRRSTPSACAQLKRKGFSDVAPGAACRHRRIRDARAAPRLQACARSTSASTPARPNSPPPPPTCTRPTRTSARPTPTDRDKIMVLGGGPNRIGQGIEFDYCCVHAALALREDGYETIMVNCNPETVSTDYDTSDRLYFEPLTLEDVLEIVEHGKAEGRDRAVRRADAAEAGARAGSQRRADHRHLARFDRPGRGPRALPAAGRETRPAAAAEPHRAQRRARRWRSRARSAIRWWCARATCSAAAQWKSCYSDADLSRYIRDAVQGFERFAGAARSLPRQRGRSRRRRDRRHARATC